jgi:hypothetical protein
LETELELDLQRWVVVEKMNGAIQRSRDIYPESVLDPLCIPGSKDNGELNEYEAGERGRDNVLSLGSRALVNALFFTYQWQANIYPETDQ